MIPSARRFRPLLLVTLLAGFAAGTPGPAAAASTSRPAAVIGVPAPGPAGTSARLVGVSCPSVEDCWAVGGLAGPVPAPLIVATTDGGHRWRRQSVRPGAGIGAPGAISAPGLATLSLAGVSCADTRHCMAAGAITEPLPGGAVAVTANGGRTWSAELGPPGDNALVAVHCSAVTTCMVLAVSGATYFSATSSDGGATWQRGASLPAGFGGATGISCSDALACRVAGDTATSPGRGSGAVTMTTDGGSTWALAVVPAGTGVLHGVSCNRSACLAVGSSSTVTTGVPSGPGALVASTDGGATFSARAPSRSLAVGLAVDCAGQPGVADPSGNGATRSSGTTAPTIPAAVCAAVGVRFTHAIPPVPLSAAVATRPQGPVIRVLGERYVPSPLVALSCPSASTCVAVGGAELATLALPPTGAMQPPPPRRRAPSRRDGAERTTTTTG